MINSAKRGVSLSLSLILMLSTLAGCGSAGKKDADASKGSAKSGPVTIRMINRINSNIVLENNSVIKEIEKQANVKLEIEAPPINNYVDKLQIVMASADLPDLIYNWGSADANYEKWAKNDLLASLDDKIEKYPNLMANISKTMWDAVRSNETGKIHGIPRPNVVNHWGYRINQEWLDKLGLKAPNTVDEFTEVLKAFTNKDPDGNGKADTYGVTFSNSVLGNNSIWYNSDFLCNAFGVPEVNGVKDIDGNYKLREKFAGYFPYLNYIKKLSDEKLIDPEFFVNKINVDQDKIDQKKVGIVYGSQVNVLAALTKVPNADKTFTYHAPLKNDKGESTDYVKPAIWGCWMIAKDSKIIDDVLKFLDWGNTAEAITLISLGIKGENYNSFNMNDKTVDRTAEQATKANNLTGTYMTIANAYKGESLVVQNGDTAERMAKYNADFNAAKSVMKTVNVPSVKSQKLQNLNTTIPDIVKKKDDMEMKYILGQVTEQAYKTFLEKEYFTATADAEKEYIDDMRKLNK